MRIVDRFETRVTPHDVVKYDPSDPSIFANVPPRVLAEIGSELTPANLQQLAEADELPLLFTEDINRRLDGRNKNKKKGLKDAPFGPSTDGEGGEEGQQEDDDADDWDDYDEEKKVKFDLPSPAQSETDSQGKEAEVAE